uniref:Uncharacterized protein n=1 Tax=Anguilla anguilla TaxID=7936 RepID=A0A0E9QHT0_ANGAN
MAQCSKAESICQSFPSVQGGVFLLLQVRGRLGSP